MGYKLDKKGFTIVELLIVIVVIAILAAITIVAFNGIQTRAENTKTINATAQYVKSLRLYKDEAGMYPLTVAPPATTYEYKCLGEIGETCGMVSGTFSGDCQSIGGITNTSSDTSLTTLNNAVKKNVTTVPQVSQQSMGCIDRNVKGAIYFVVNTAAYVRYYLKGNVPCDPVNGVNSAKEFFAPQTSVCLVTLP